MVSFNLLPVFGIGALLCKQQAENLNGALVSGYARSNERLNGALEKRYAGSRLNGVTGVPTPLCCMVQKFLSVCGFY